MVFNIATTRDPKHMEPKEVVSARCNALTFGELKPETGSYPTVGESGIAGLPLKKYQVATVPLMVT